MNDIRKMIDKVNKINKSIVNVYRCINDIHDIKYDKIEYFAVNKEYAKSFGKICYHFQINTHNAKIFDLSKWNKLYTEKTGKNGNLYNRHQGLFVIGQISISTSYEKELSVFSQVFNNNMVEEFLHEFNTCDAIYGEDAGYPNEFVFAVKNKKLLKYIGKE